MYLMIRYMGFLEPDGPVTVVQVLGKYMIFGYVDLFGKPRRRSRSSPVLGAIVINFKYSS